MLVQPTELPPQNTCSCLWHLGPALQRSFFPCVHTRIASGCSGVVFSAFAALVNSEDEDLSCCFHPAAVLLGYNLVKYICVIPMIFGGLFCLIRAILSHHSDKLFFLACFDAECCGTKYPSRFLKPFGLDERFLQCCTLMILTNHPAYQ